VGRLVLIDALGAAALFGLLWYFYFVRYNRRKGALVLRWVEAACSSKGRLLQAHWSGASLVQAHLDFAAHWFENAQVVVRLRPRPIPLKWLFSLWRKQKETLTFEADLDYAPGFHLEVFRHRWLTHRHTRVVRGSRNWAVSRPWPVVLTTRTHWSHELTPVVNTLMTSRGHNLVSVRFRPESPHLAATVPLEALPDEQATAAFLSVLRDLAAGASTSRQ